MRTTSVLVLVLLATAPERLRSQCPDGSALPCPTARAAAKPAATPGAIEIGQLFQHWVRSSEEEPAGTTVQVFRPVASRDFPPSRFRMAYKFTRDGRCEWYFLSPDDDHRFKPGTWKRGARDTTLLLITASGTTTTVRIVALSRGLLQLDPAVPKPR